MSCQSRKTPSPHGTYPRIGNPAICLHQRRRTEILVLVPPIRRTAGRTTGTKDTLVETIELLAVLRRLQKFALFWRVVVLEIRFNGFVLFVEEREVGNEVLDDVH